MMTMQIITRQEAAQQGLSRYYTGKPCKHGHVAERQVSNHCCITCANKRQREKAKLTRVWSIDAQRRKKARQAAIDAGEKTYFHGIPCKRGHIAPRQTINGMCMECAKEKNSSEKMKAYKKQHKLKNKDRYLEKQRKTRAENPEKFKEYHRNYFQANKEKLTKQNRQRHKEKVAADPAYREKVRKQKEEWRINNRDYFTKYAIKRSTVLQKATPSWADLSAITTKYKERECMNGLTGVEHHVDHIIPLQGKNVCGLHVASNLRVILARDNLAKSNKHA